MNARLSTHRGYAITTHWTEIDQMLSGKPAGFKASYVVSMPSLNRQSWQRFPAGVFDTSVAAAANARIAAMTSIDGDLAAIYLFVPERPGTLH